MDGLNPLQTLLFITLGLSILFVGYISDKLFTLMEKKAPEYYKSIERPKMNTMNFFRRNAVMNFCLLLAMDLPEDYPKHKLLLKYAKQLRITCIVSIITFVLLVITSIQSK